MPWATFILWFQHEIRALQDSLSERGSSEACGSFGRVLRERVDNDSRVYNISQCLGNAFMGLWRGDLFQRDESSSTSGKLTSSAETIVYEDLFHVPTESPDAVFIVVKNGRSQWILTYHSHVCNAFSGIMRWIYGPNNRITCDLEQTWTQACYEYPRGMFSLKIAKEPRQHGHGHQWWLHDRYLFSEQTLAFCLTSFDPSATNKTVLWCGGRPTSDRTRSQCLVNRTAWAFRIPKRAWVDIS